MLLSQLILYQEVIRYYELQMLFFNWITLSRLSRNFFFILKLMKYFAHSKLYSCVYMSIWYLFTLSLHTVCSSPSIVWKWFAGSRSSQLPLALSLLCKASLLKWASLVPLSSFRIQCHCSELSFPYHAKLAFFVLCQAQALIALNRLYFTYNLFSCVSQWCQKLLHKNDVSDVHDRVFT